MPLTRTVAVCCLASSIALPAAGFAAVPRTQVLQFAPITNAGAAAVHDDALCGLRFVPATLAANGKFSTTIVMWNSGSTTWKREEVKLAAPAATWGASAVMFDESVVGPGQKATFVLGALTTPPAAGTYAFEWQMARGGSRFGERCNTTVSVTPGTASASSSSLSQASSKPASSSSAPSLPQSGASALRSVANANPDAARTTLNDKTRKDIAAYTFIAACGQSSVTIRTVTFDVRAENMSLDPAQFVLHPQGKMTGGIRCNAETIEGNAVPDATGAFYVTCKPPNATIAPCTSLTLALQGYVRNARLLDATRSALTVSLGQFTNRSHTTSGPDASHLVWVETSPVRSITHFWLDFPTDPIPSGSYAG